MFNRWQNQKPMARKHREKRLKKTRQLCEVVMPVMPRPHVETAILTDHAIERATERNLSVYDIRNAIKNGNISTRGKDVVFSNGPSKIIGAYNKEKIVVITCIRFAPAKTHYRANNVKIPKCKPPPTRSQKYKKKRGRYKAIEDPLPSMNGYVREKKVESIISQKPTGKKKKSNRKK